MSTPVYLRELCTNGLTSAGESRMSVNRCSSRVRTSRVVARWTHALLTLLQYMRKLVLQSTRSNLEIGACIVVVDASEPECQCVQIVLAVLILFLADLRSQILISNLETQISNLTSRISDLKSQISNFRSQISDLKSRISNINAKRHVSKHHCARQPPM